MMKVLLLLIVSVVLTVVSAASYSYKNNVVPPSQFRNAPTVQDAAMESSEVSFPVFFAADQVTSDWTFSQRFPVDSSQEVKLSVHSPDVQSYTIEVQPPTSNVFIGLDTYASILDSVQPGVTHKHEGTFGWALTNVPSVTYILPKPEIGQWNVKITAPKAKVLVNSKKESASPKPQAFLLIENPDEVGILTHMNSYEHKVGDQIGVVARIFDSNVKVPEGELPLPLKAISTVAFIYITKPDLSTVTIKMHDDGENFDGEAEDGIYGGTIKAEQTGIYVANTVMRVTSASGTELMRSTRTQLQVIESSVALTGNVYADVSKGKEADMFQLQFEINHLKPAKSQFLAYAEVYGADNVAIAAVNGMSAVTTLNGKNVITLQMSTKWIEKMQAKAPFTVKNVQIKCPNSNLPISSFASASVDMSSKLASVIPAINAAAASMPITEEMRKGPRPAFVDRVVTSEATTRTIALIHGYCTDQTPFDVGMFSGHDYVVFEDFSQSRSTDEFAKLIIDFLAAKGKDAYALVGHSQGGMANVHLYNYYWSDLDRTAAGEILQSLGTPYQGSTLAGSAADLGKAFGVGCGQSSALSRDGAVAWNQGIVQESRKAVYYYTTQYKRGIFNSKCNFATSLVLNTDNDGITEKKYSNLPDATHVSHVNQQCHSRDMAYVAQSLVTDRINDIIARATSS